jgi:hypothetical protein
VKPAEAESHRRIQGKIASGILAFFISAFCLQAWPAAARVVLKKVDSYPRAPDDYYFRPLVGLSISGNGLFACENFGHKILKFSIENGMKLVQEIGKRGQGPGDLNLPSGLSVWQDEIAVMDELGISIFDMAGGFRERFKRLLSPGSFAFTGDRIYVLDFNPDQKHLIKVLSRKGESLGACGGKSLDIDFSKFKGLSPSMVERSVYEGRLITDGKKLYYLNKSFGDLLEYDREGRELSRADFTAFFGDPGRRIRKANYRTWIEEGLDLVQSKGMFRYFPIILDAQILDGIIYLLSDGREPGDKTGNKELVIKAVDTVSLDVKGDYFFPMNGDDPVFCFAVGGYPEIPVFYVSMGTDSGFVINVLSPAPWAAPGPLTTEPVSGK